MGGQAWLFSVSFVVFFWSERAVTISKMFFFVLAHADVHCKISSKRTKTDEHTGNILQIYFIVTVHHIEKMFFR
jgi:hypothetical protein